MGLEKWKTGDGYPPQKKLKQLEILLFTGKVVWWLFQLNYNIRRKG